MSKDILYAVDAVDPDPHRSAFIFHPGFGSWREKLKKNTEKMQGNWCPVPGNNFNLIKKFMVSVNQNDVFFFTFEQSFLSFSTPDNSS